jgi:hypothetical protein
MSERVDLDAVQAAYEASKAALSTHPKDCTNNCYDGPCDCSGQWQVKGWTFDPAPVPALVAELRVARKVVEALIRRPCIFCGYGEHNFGCPLAAYDRHTQPPTQEPAP